MPEVIDKKKILIIIIITSFLSAYLIGLLFNNQFSLFDAQINDHFFRFRYAIKKNEAIDHRIVLITLGDSVLQKQQLNTWDRRIYGKLITILKDAGVKAIAMDIVFQHKSFVENDQTLIKAVENAENVFFPLILNPSKLWTDNNSINRQNQAGENSGILIYPRVLRHGEPIIAREDILPFKELIRYSHSLGHINCDADNDGLNRRFPLLIQSGKNNDAYYPGLAFRMIYEYLGVHPENIEVSFGEKIVLKDAELTKTEKSTIEIPIDNKGRMIINWAGPWYGNTFPNYSAERLLEVTEDPVGLLRLKKILEGALVIIANVSTPYNDHGPGIFEKIYPFAGVHLNVANSILTQNFIQFPGVFTTYILPWIMALLLLFLSIRLKLFHLLLSYTGLFMIFGMVNAGVFLFFNRLTSPAIPMTGLLLSGIFVFAYRFIIEERERIELKAAKENEKFQKEFIQDIAHELKTPLTLILGPIEALIENPYKDIEEKINLVSRNTQKLLYLINQFLQLSKLETGKTRVLFQPIDIVHFLQNKFNNFGYLLNKKAIKSTLKNNNKNEVVVYADINKLDIIFNNIFLNAYTYTREKGKVVLEISTPLPLQQALREKQWPQGIPDTMVIIKISDNGIGIPGGELKQIFERTMQGQTAVTASHTGTGIGLYLAKKYIDLHYGEIEAKSEQGKGTEFIITLPMGNNHLKESDLTHRQPFTTRTGEDRQTGNILNIYTHELKSNLSKQENKPIHRKKGIVSNGTILIVEDNPDMRSHIKSVLEEYYETVEAVNGKDGYEKARKIKPDLILTDVRMPEMDGIQFLKEIKQNKSLCNIPVIFITVYEYADLQQADGMWEPDEYLTKPFSAGILLSRVKNILVLKNQKKELSVLEKQLHLEQPEVFSNIKTNNIQMKTLFKQIEQIAPSSKPVLITGETGVGKELVAKAIHNASKRKGAYKKTNIAAHNKDLVSDALFGHIKGAYSGADTDKDGLIKEAENGTLFLDEIGDLNYETQTKLLRVLDSDTGEYERLGSTKTELCKARIIAATNKNLNKLMEKDSFKFDLLNRFIYKIHIPPLRERKDDLLLLLDHFFNKFSNELKKPKPEKIPNEVIKSLRNYSFPNNARDLINMVHNALTDFEYDGTLKPTVFRQYINENPGNMGDEDIIFPGTAKTITFSGGFFTLDEVEEIYIKEVLRKTNDDFKSAEGILGREKSSIYRRMRNYAEQE